MGYGLRSEKSVAGLLVIALLLASVTVGILSIMNSTSANSDSSPNSDPAGTLNVTVVNSTGAPIYGASVVSVAQPIGQEPLTGLTDTYGNVSFTNLTAGVYTLVASKSGYADGYGNATVQDNQTTSIGITLSSTQSLVTALLLNTDKQEYLLNQPISITATFLYNGQPVNMALTSVEVRDPNNELVYISTGQTNQTGSCTFRIKSELNWLTGNYSIFGASFSNEFGSISARTSFKIVILTSNVIMESAWVYNPILSAGQNLTLGPLGEYWSLCVLFNLGNGSASVSDLTFANPASLVANSIQAFVRSPGESPTFLSYSQTDNTIYIHNVTLASEGVLAVILDTNVSQSASYTSIVTANWQDTNLLFEANGSRSLTLNAVWDMSNPIIITAFANTGTTSTGGTININATLFNAGSSNVTFVYIAQVTDSNGVPLAPVIQSVTLVADQSLEVSIGVNIPSGSPQGVYAINFALYTELPSNGGHAINYEQSTATIN